MLCTCYYFFVGRYYPDYLDYWEQCYMCTPYINFRPMNHSRLYSAIGSTSITIEETVKRKKKKRKEEFLDASSRGLSVEITMLRVNISFQFGLKSGGQILD